jgi:hypothetical protein
MDLPASCQGPLVDLTPTWQPCQARHQIARPKAQPGAGCPGARAKVKFAAGLRVPPPRYTGGTRQVYPRYMPCGMRATRCARRQAGRPGRHLQRVHAGTKSSSFPPG